MSNRSTPSRMRKTCAYSEGRIAAEDGITENPYPDYTQRYLAWNLGYQEYQPPQPEKLDPEKIIRDLLEHAVWDRQRTDECESAVDAAERWLEQQ